MTSQLLINEPPLQVLPSLACAVGLNEAIVLQQVHYWLNPRFNKNAFEGKYWVHNTFKQWQRQFPFWNERTIQRVVAILEERGYLISFITKGFKKTKYYTVNYDALNLINPEHSEELFLEKTSQERDLEQNSLNASQNPENQSLDVSEFNDPTVTTSCRDRYRQNVVLDADNLSFLVTTKCRPRDRQVVGLSYREYTRDYYRD